VAVTEVHPKLDMASDLSSAIPAACRGDDEAFRTVYRAVQPGLVRYLRGLVGEDAEDVAAEAWIQIVRELRSFKGDASGFRAWTTTIARYRALDHLRARGRRPVSAAPVEALIEVPADSDTAARADEAISTNAAIALIATLPRDQAEAVLLRVVVGMDANSAGKLLGKRAGAVRTAAYRGIRQLAELLDRTDWTAPP
jgi:RNA polymerase sigma-70 factor, ECF subfamily